MSQSLLGRHARIVVVAGLLAAACAVVACGGFAVSSWAPAGSLEQEIPTDEDAGGDAGAETDAAVTEAGAP